MAGLPGYPRVDDPDSRDGFFRRAVAAGSAVLVGGAMAAALPRLASSAQSPAQDAEIFNFALLLEQLQASFYDEATAQAALPAKLLEFARVAAGHEREHVGYLTEALGSSAQDAPATEFGEATTDPEAFATAAAALEDIAVAAYNGQAANLTAAGLQAAARVVSVDARHAAWVRAIAGRPPASQPVDAPLSRGEVEERLAELGFIREA